MVKTYFKMLFRMFGKHYTRLLSILVMVLVSVGFVSGIGSATNKIDFSLEAYYKDKNVSDFIIRSTSQTGFTEEQILSIQSAIPDAEINKVTSFDSHTDEENKRSLRVYFVDFGEWTVNKPDLIEGVAPETAFEAYCEQADDVIKGYNVGDEAEIPLFPVKVKISGIILSPLTFAVGGEPSDYNPEGEMGVDTAGTKNLDCLENILYVSKDIAPYIPVNTLFVALRNRNAYERFSDEYVDYVNSVRDGIYSVTEDVKVLTLKDNYSFSSLDYYSEKVEQIGYLLMGAFLFVTALVALSTMTRLLEEERGQIACLKTLGYGYFGIISKYLLFAFIATGIGGGAAYAVGYGLSHLLYYVFNYSFAMPPVLPRVAMFFYAINFALIALATLGATAFAGFKMTNEYPANLLRPVPPKAGKKVILEKIPILWNRLSFKYKSTVRNVLRYKSRFILTVVSVAVSLSLVMAGLALLDACLFSDFGSPAIMSVAVVIVLFAGLLTASVIYTLTGISISERNREIATLMVLGYNDNEVCGYIYREIYINTGIGIIFGYPTSALITYFALKIINAGSLSDVSWFMWLVAPAVVLVFTAIVTLILRHRIVGIDMNESLKAIE